MIERPAAAPRPALAWPRVVVEPAARPRPGGAGGAGCGPASRPPSFYMAASSP
ncbi:hypothetical protein [Dankookia sp. P2]|uniref:hypothetical protein n=1 Tax=Dankookia sp. P2 TaxID=3423955 RepID=UPI003D665840